MKWSILRDIYFTTIKKLQDKKEDSNNHNKNKQQIKSTHQKSEAKKLMKIMNNYFAINFLKVSEAISSTTQGCKTEIWGLKGITARQQEEFTGNW